MPARPAEVAVDCLRARYTPARAVEGTSCQQGNDGLLMEDPETTGEGMLEFGWTANESLLLPTLQAASEEGRDPHLTQVIGPAIIT